MSRKISFADRIDFFIRYRVLTLPRIIRNKVAGNRAKTNSILFYPALCHKRTVMYKLCRRLGIKMTGNIKGKYDIAIAWDDSTLADYSDLKNLKSPVLNLNCDDISKKKVDEVFESVFGYGVNINPKNYKGQCVIKSDDNAQHDGRIITAPVKEVLPGVVYQKVLDNSLDENSVYDIRTPVIGDKIPLVYYKIKKNDKRFTNDLFRAELHETDSILSKEEQEKIVQFSKKMGLDYGELDIIRDNNDKKIYIIDVNKTPWGPPATISEEDSAKTLKLMEKSFIRLINS